MFTNEIQHILDHGIWIKRLQAKVCAKDLLPKQKPSDVKAYIINTAKSHKSGEHWVAVIFYPNGKAVYFDSYGLPPLEMEIIHFIQNNSRSWTYSNQTIQSRLGKVCGHYCIFALDGTARGYKLPKLLRKTFSTKNFHKNDRAVSSWFMQNFKRIV